MRVMSLDIGEKRIGVALSDTDARIASPLTVFPGPLSAALSALRRVVEDYEIGLILIGLPLTFAGEEGPQALSVRNEAAILGPEFGLPVIFADERLSSTEARRSMGSAGLSDREQRGKVDMVAAAIILQTYLDSGGPARDGIDRDD